MLEIILLRPFSTCKSVHLLAGQRRAFLNLKMIAAGTVDKWLALSPHSEKVLCLMLGLSPVNSLGPFLRKSGPI